MKYTKFIVISLVTACFVGSIITAIRSSANQERTSDGVTIVVMHVEPGHKLIEMGKNQDTVWMQTRPAQEGEEFGSILHTEYYASTGKPVRKYLVVEQERLDSSIKQSPMINDEDPKPLRKDTTWQ